VVFATVYIFSLLGLVINLISDLTYTWVNPRIDFETRVVLLRRRRPPRPQSSRR